MEDIIKIAIIHGEKLVDGQNRDGEIDYLTCTLDDEDSHTDLILKYLEENYMDDKILQDDNNFNNKYGIIYYLCKIGEVVFLNETSYKKEVLEKYGKNGIIILPKEMTDHQKISLLELQQKIKNYDGIQVWCDIESTENYMPIKTGKADVIDEFINSKTR